MIRLHGTARGGDAVLGYWLAGARARQGRLYPATSCGSCSARPWHPWMASLRTRPPWISIARRMVSERSHEAGSAVTVCRNGSSAPLVSQVAEFRSGEGESSTSAEQYPASSLILWKTCNP